MHKSKTGVNFPFPRTVLLELARSPSTSEIRSGEVGAGGAGAEE